MFLYSAFGLTIRSNQHIPGLVPVTVIDTSQCVTITLGSFPTKPASGRTVYLSEVEELGVPGVVLREIDSTGDYSFEYGDGTCALVSRDGGEVWATWPETMTVEDAAAYLLGPIMNLVLRLQGGFSLHAGVVALDGRAVAIAGGPEAGKSTLVGAFARRGTRIMSDDIAPLFEEDGAFFVHSTYPRVRLWRDSVEHLFGVGSELPRLSPTWDKRYLDVGERGQFEARPRPLSAIFVLGERTDSAAFRIERLSERDAFASILAQLHTVWMLPESPQREVFAIATRLAGSVPAFRLITHSDPARLAELCDAIEETVASPVATRGAFDVPAP